MEKVTAQQRKTIQKAKHVGRKQREEVYHRPVKISQSIRERSEANDLSERIMLEMPPAGKKWVPFAKLGFEKETSPTEVSEASNDDSDRIDLSAPLSGYAFADLPLSQYTLNGLKANRFIRMTDIQSKAIPHALAGRDVMGQAKTGSGKTLAFVLPVLEILFRLSWGTMDGLGALVISPTRELATQIFEVITTVGRHHSNLSAGCLVGGKKTSVEARIVDQLNIVVACPGRLQQHMDESAQWNADNLQILVVDEADRLLDRSFIGDLQTALSQLPPPGKRQTLLFSATLESSAKQTEVVGLKSPEVITVDTDGRGIRSVAPTPTALIQHYVVVPLQRKIDTLFSFLRTHPHKKIMVFVATRKQADFLYEIMRTIKAGPAVLKTRGKMSFQKRLDAFAEFRDRQRAVCMICTDICARGVDMPKVDWVVQYDCPVSVDDYVHRVGRTARYGAGGQSLLILLPSEMVFLEYLEKRYMQPVQLSINKDKARSIESKLQSMMAADSSGYIKKLAQGAFRNYLRSVMEAGNPQLFKIEALELEPFALSLGFASAPEAIVQELKERSSSKAIGERVDDGKEIKAKNKFLDMIRQIREEKKKHTQKREKRRGEEADKEKPGADDDEEDDDFFSVKLGKQTHDLIADGHGDACGPEKSTPTVEIDEEMERKELEVLKEKMEQARRKERGLVFRSDGTAKVKGMASLILYIARYICICVRLHVISKRKIYIFAVIASLCAVPGGRDV
eukprot:GHVN01079393.1.p1 GENE.GHVN01079393.1~~GHVN01079393.1.p1  ORF type:complete len:737 (-),score=116.24 GHVN01079393.1:1906-4116(-)